MAPHLTQIHRYPLKSCRGETLSEALVEPWGLAGDRRWMLVDGDGKFISAREHPSLVLIVPEITDQGLRVVAPHLPELPPLTVVADHRTQVPVSIWKSQLTAAASFPEADAWFSGALQAPVRLVHLDDPGRRGVDPRFSEPTDRVSFADGFPLLLTTEESLEAVNISALEATPGQDALAMTRFRPNVVVSGHPPWAEDDWRRLRIGNALFRAVKGCARCVITTIDPETGKREKDPLATLARIRRWGTGVWFGVNLVPDSPGATIRIGDEVEILEAAEPGQGPLRATG